MGYPTLAQIAALNAMLRLTDAKVSRQCFPLDVVLLEVLGNARRVRVRSGSREEVWRVSWLPRAVFRELGWDVVDGMLAPLEAVHDARDA